MSVEAFRTNNHYVPGMYLSRWSSDLSSLSRREAIFVGEAAAIPARIKIRELSENQRPDSADISFSQGWAQDPRTEVDIATTTAKWLSN